MGMSMAIMKVIGVGNILYNLSAKKKECFSSIISANSHTHHTPRGLCKRMIGTDWAIVAAQSIYAARSHRVSAMWLLYWSIPIARKHSRASSPSNSQSFFLCTPNQ